MTTAPAKALSWVVVQQVDRLVDLLLRQAFKTSALREKLPQQAIGVFIRFSLSRRMRIRKINLCLQRFYENLMLCKFLAATYGLCDVMRRFNLPRLFISSWLIVGLFAGAVSQFFGRLVLFLSAIHRAGAYSD